MNIKIIGSGCEKCEQLYDNVKAAVDELALDAVIERVEDLIEMVKLGVMSSPSLMVDGKLVVSGRVVPKEKIIELITSSK